ncbi:hypothetical protein NKR23_g8321 [Pleurostoma richardsiae]|uniref:Uncharacterized protein n=1 Tax=Pleurostoma richardsiae TaxID=41990 RepID=A0AA38RIJ0_9PEZI|nr:hypothetical protein NKR23_g8321 [Pleurostoma richardsiae]
MELDNSNCACPFNTEKSGIYNGQSAPECLSECRSDFLLKAAGNDTISQDVCDRLQAADDASQQTTFWPLYWCDVSLCGVWIDPKNVYGQDPNVDLIINTCHNLGVEPISDSGPPPDGYDCTFCNSGTPKQGGAVSSGSLSASGLATAPQVTTSVVRLPSSTSGAESTQTSEAKASTTPVVPQASGTTGHDAPPVSSKGGISTETKIAIGVCSAVGFIAIALLAFLLLLRHKRREQSYPSTLRKRIRITHDFSAPGAGSPAPLISPANSTTSEGRPPLTPPLRLRDRKFLPSILQQAVTRQGSPPPFGSPLYADHLRDDFFPSSPICAPTTNKLEPRQEKAGKVLGFKSAPPPVSFSLPRSSLGSYAASGTTTLGSSSLRREVVSTSTDGTYPNANIGIAVLPDSAVSTPPSSPTRPPRPHDTPLEIPGLLTAKAVPGPPPNRGLPPPPLSPPPTSPLPVSPLSPPPPAFLTRGSGTAPHAARLASPSASPLSYQRGLPAASVEPTKGRTQDARDSWGSWAGTGSALGGLGVAISSPAHVGNDGASKVLRMQAQVPDGSRSPGLSSPQEAGAGAPLLHEEDLETLGGRY